ncbi:Gfo/Idh/MocA family oxidoreductase [Paenibacillus amylolyticus]|uniref:Gfo/Idh/MocA family oxidoreductase n=1 Tax=Paenibacillus amylolyticus TaxID=1451 RepID=A0A5M9WYQ7_PAEAM|nr:Gfo/Idh/MocA family oxidoreductase [Paenibacillus amylolyticus]KAA8786810.1 Gfo/Idh/MocA family oxidoreductase [Paenibacillus amylolyticus]
MVRFGVVGTNWITERLLESAVQVQGFELTAVYSRTEDKANAFADRYDAAYRFTDLEEMAASDTLDAVYIATPNTLHAQQAELFLRHGKHVLCEKPLAANASEVHSMIETARKHDVLLMEAMKSTLVPVFKSVEKHLPKIGPIRKYIAGYSQYSSRYDKYKEGIVLNAFKPELANGALMDLGVYCLYPLITLFGAPNQVQSQAMMLESGVDGQGSVLLNYDGMDAVVTYSKISNSHVPSEIMGERGSIIIDKIGSPEHAEIRYNDGTIEVLTVEQQHPAMYYEVEEFVNLVQQGKLESTMNTYERSHQTMKVMDQIRQQIGLVFPND